LIIYREVLQSFITSVVKTVQLGLSLSEMHVKNVTVK